jgi:uncharacterized protein YdhG (YjbR/CyaY superfamily)
MTETKKSANRNAIDDTSGKWTDDEIDAMKEHAKELKAAKRRGGDKEAAGEADLLAKIAEMPPADRDMAERIHGVIKVSAPELSSRTWYGMPAYAKDGKVVCHFQTGAKFGSRYATFGFSDEAKLDDGNMWPTSWALTALSAADEAKIAALVKRAVR